MKEKKQFELHDKVNVLPIKRDGIILSIWETVRGYQYEVRYFDSVECKTTYFFDFELELLK